MSSPVSCATWSTSMRNLVDADTSSMTLALAGRFAPTPELFALANRSSKLMDELFGLVRGTLRPDVVLHDVSLAFELIAAVKVANPERTAELRHRYLALVLDGLRARERRSHPGAPRGVRPPGPGARPRRLARREKPELPGPPPGWPDISDRWVPKT